MGRGFVGCADVCDMIERSDLVAALQAVIDDANEVKETRDALAQALKQRDEWMRLAKDLGATSELKYHAGRLQFELKLTLDEGLLRQSNSPRMLVREMLMKADRQFAAEIEKLK